MRFWQKFVSSSVLAVVVLLPFLSMAMCLPQDSGSMPCPPECPMMSKMGPGHDSVEMKPSAAPDSCCYFKSSKPAPVTESQTVSPVVSVEPVTTAVVFVATPKERHVTTINSSPPAVADSQAQLCTFLI